MENDSKATLSIYTVNGQLLLEKSFTKKISFELDYKGLLFIKVQTSNSILTKKSFFT